MHTSPDSFFMALIPRAPRPRIFRSCPASVTCHKQEQRVASLRQLTCQAVHAWRASGPYTHLIVIVRKDLCDFCIGVLDMGDDVAQLVGLRNLYF
jgi:hypothetical protein